LNYTELAKLKKHKAKEIVILKHESKSMKRKLREGTHASQNPKYESNQVISTKGKTSFHYVT